jgi:fatty acid synthase, animal type
LFHRTWKSRSISIAIETFDVSTQLGCRQLIESAVKLGPVGGIFNLAVALRDGIFENQTLEMFEESLGPKAEATKHLDEISREVCPKLEQFVVFSSVACGRGNSGQSNYGMANSIMERVVENRSKDGLPSKAIQWGVIGDVGLLAKLHEANLKMEIGGTLPQQIQNCLDVLDTLLSVSDPIVASMVVAEKKFEDFSKGNVIDAVLNILSIHDKKSVSMHVSLSTIGLDSLMGVEIQQVLERDFDISLSSQELRSISLSQLEKRVCSKKSPGASNTNNEERIADNLEMLLTNLGDEETSETTILKLESQSDSEETKALIIPGIEGMAGGVWREVAANLKFSTYILQLGGESDKTSLETILDSISKVR